MCDTRTWVLKLLVVFLIIHFSRIHHCRVAASTGFAAATDVEAGGADIAAAGAISIDDDDSFEITSSPEDTLLESQRSTLLNTTFGNRKSNKDEVQSSSSSSSSSVTGSIANRLASDDGVADGDEGANVAAATDNDEDADGSDEEFSGSSQRKFNNAADNDADREAAAESRRALVFGILKSEDDEKDYVGDTTPSAAPTESISVAALPWKGSSDNDDDDNDDDEDDVDEILQPMMMISSDKPHYSSNNGGRTMGSALGYSMGYHAKGNTDGDEDGSNGYKESSLTNRIKPAYSSAFEEHKALIRNSKRYGHKSHKKKYKDYMHLTPPTTMMTKTTTYGPGPKNVLSRDRIYNSDDIPRSYYPGHVNYYMNTDFDGDADRKDQTPSANFRSYHSPSYPRHYQQQQHHTSGHLRNGGRYRHNGVQRKSQRPQTPSYPDYNLMNYHHLGSRAKQQHQKELEKKIDEYSQYYSKWPHLAQVEDQLFDDEHTDVLYPDGDAMSSNPAELVFAAEDDVEPTEKEDEDPNLPPYIKKYRRRNKQLLNLLEGTKPPSTPPPQWSSSVLKPGPIEGSHQNPSPHHHLRQHRQHNHHHRQHSNRQRSHRHKKWQIEDLFEEQRANPNNPNKTTTYSDKLTSHPSSSSTSTTTASTTALDEHVKLLQDNKLPAEDVSISRELYDWAIEIGRDSPVIEPDTTDYNEHSQNQNGVYSWKATSRNARPAVKPITTTTLRPVASVRRPNVYGSIMKSPPVLTTSTAKPINSFVYHRVVEAPRVVGAGQTGRKQRLPFVAITDRRLETTRKGMGNAGVLARKDFEQNHFPMP